VVLKKAAIDRRGLRAAYSVQQCETGLMIGFTIMFSVWHSKLAVSVAKANETKN